MRDTGEFMKEFYFRKSFYESNTFDKVKFRTDVRKGVLNVDFKLFAYSDFETLSIDLKPFRSGVYEDRPKDLYQTDGIAEQEWFKSMSNG